MKKVIIAMMVLISLVISNVAVINVMPAQAKTVSVHKVKKVKKAKVVKVKKAKKAKVVKAKKAKKIKVKKAKKTSYKIQSSKVKVFKMSTKIPKRVKVKRLTMKFHPFKTHIRLG